MVEEIYRQLSKAHGFPESKYLPNIFETCLTKEEVSVLLSLPATPEEVATKLSVKVPKVAKTLRELFKKGFVVYKQVDDILRYGLVNDLATFILPDKRDFEKFGAEFLDLWTRHIDEDYIPSFDPSEFKLAYARVIPVEKTIPMKWGEILPYEKISEILQNACMHRYVCVTCGTYRNDKRIHSNPGCRCSPAYRSRRTSPLFSPHASCTCEFP